MAEIKKINTEFQLLDKFLDTSGDAGTSGQVLSSTASGVNWVDGSAIPGVPGGSGTLNTIPLWTPDGDTLGNSIITQPASSEIRVAGKLKVDSSVTGYSSTKIQTGGFSDSQSGINILNSTTGYGYILFGDGSGADLYKGQIAYKHGDDFMAFNTNGSQKMTINSIGYVGIGTTTTTANFHVTGSSSSGNLPIAKIISTGSISYLKFFNSSSGTAATDGTYIGMNGGTAYLINKEAGNLYLGTGDAINLTLQNGGNVGIGTTNPSQSLDVSGNVIFRPSGTSDTISFLSLGSSQSRLSTTNNFAIWPGQSEAMRLLANGNVGIGTTSPQKLLEVKSSTAYNSTLRLQTSAHNWDIQGGEAGYSSTAFALDYDGTTFFRAIGITDSRFSGGLSVGTINAAPPTGGLYVAGNVGIGTTSPSEKLEVNGARSKLNGILIGENNSDIQFPGDGQLAVGNNDWLIVNEGGTEVMRTGGPFQRLGIGTTSPSEKLQVAGTIFIDDGILKITKNAVTNYYESTQMNSYGTSYDWKFAGSNVMRITSTGKVGIGTTNPNNELEVLGGGSPRISLRTTSEAVSEALELGFQVGTGANSSANSVGIIKSVITQANPSALKGDLVFQTNSGDSVSTKMVIKDDGNVGIGTVSPSTKLEVISAVNEEGIAIKDASNNLKYKVRQFGGNTYSSFWNASNVEQVRITSSGTSYFNGGNVGIGTTSPASKLHVAGSSNEQIKLVGSTGRVSINSASNSLEMYAWGSGVNIYSTQTDSVFFGRDAGVSNKFYYYDSSNVSTMLVNTSTGRVGIKNTNPSTELHVTGDIRQQGSSYSVNITGGGSVNGDNHLDIAANASYLNLRSPYNSIFYRASSDHAFRDAGGSNEYLRIKTSGTNAGNVGIGTTSPTSALHVVGTQVYEGYVKFENTVHAIRLDLKSSSHTANIYMDGTGGVISGGGLIFNAPTARTHFMESGTPKMSIISGNVGIGTTSPGSKLEVSSGAGANGDSILTISADTDNSTSSSSPKIVMSQKGGTKVSVIEMDSSNRTSFSNGDGHYFSGGNVGIGTTSPGYELDVNGVVRGSRFFVGTNAAASQWAFHARNNNSTADSGLYFNSNSSEIYLRNSSNVIGARIRSNSASYFNGGDVGIGIAVPQERLHVSGETHPSIKLSSSSDGNYNVILNCGYRNEALNLSVGGYNVFTTEGFNTPETTHLYSNNSKALSLASNQAATFTSTVTATNFINSSDERLKENIKEVRDNNVEVNWKTFNFKTEKEQKRYGVIAQELEKTNPEFVREDSQGFKSVAYIDLLIAKIAELEARIQKLEK